MAPARSWVRGADDPEGGFPLQNLPYGVISRPGEEPRCAVAIGGFALDLEALERAGLLRLPESADTAHGVFGEADLNAFMGLGPEAWSAVRRRLTALLEEDGDPALRADAGLSARALIPLGEVRGHLPFRVTEFTDFYSGRQHAVNAGTMLRGPENPLPPNWLHMPIGYNGRASTVVVSGTDVVRPCGQLKPKGAEAPHFGASRRLDFELEMGTVVGLPSEMGRRLSVAEAERAIFGYVLLNDWSARDIQGWEAQPLGPFQAKVFATTIGAWVVPAEALAPFRAPAPEREVPLLPYLEQAEPGLFDVALEARLEAEGRDLQVCRTNWREMYFSPAQQLAHHSASGCAMRTGDLLGSGTVSGAEKGSWGSMLEASWGGREPLELGEGVTRSFLEDGDRVTLRGWAQGDGYRIGFGECAGRILPARED